MIKQIKKHKIKPFRYKATALELNINGFSVDSDDGDTEHVFPDRRLVELDRYDNYQTVEINGDIRYPDSGVKDLVPEEEEEEPPLDLVVVVRGTRTSQRRVILREDINEFDSADKITVELDKQNFRGKVKLEPYLIRRTDGDFDTNHADMRSAKVAAGRPWTLRFDRFEDVGSRGLESRWIPFSNEDDLPVSEGMLYYLNLKSEVNPELLLNSDSGDLKRIMEAKGTRGPDARLRDVFYQQILVPVNVELIISAVDTLDSETLEFGYDWQKAMVLNILDEILYDRSLSGREAKLRELVEIRDRNTGHQEIVGRVQRAVQESENTRKVLDKLIEVSDEWQK